MDDNVVVVAFADQSKAYQALSLLRQADAAGRLEVRATALLERGPDAFRTRRGQAYDLTRKIYLTQSCRSWDSLRACCGLLDEV